MKFMLRVLQISFTYIGTVVGAGFATGQEILQFFTKFGKVAPFTILIATVIFIWLGTKLMLISHRIKARSYEDVNITLFGPHAGRHISLFTLIVLILVNSVMLAGAGSVFHEHLNLHYQTGLLITIAASYWVINRGMNAILHLNSIVVPTMLLFTIFIMWHTIELPNTMQAFTLVTDKPLYAAWSSSLLYGAFNLAMAQAVLVPLGASMPDERCIKWGGWIGGILIGCMLFAGHFALSAHMPGITQYDIPMGHIAYGLGFAIQMIYIVLIFSEIFTTFIADIYGITLQLQHRIHIPSKWIIAVIMLFCYLMSQFGFKPLVSYLYPLFGLFSVVWLVLLIRLPMNKPIPHQPVPPLESTTEASWAWLSKQKNKPRA
ncbi:hypothetical protein MH117_01515 [Paenibacillus sp. ACRRX]|uniref:YkvI family membrane protein n=1 Tax=unclassified Paenibacillus TaxID=185978 RepID=UPI001EF4CAB1|nr:MULTISPECIES: hypothetical protein [unclassified Paenibacillus]MCG7406080.1 hypothetical protein [Paenibacillus sp. ACRRX]MDK8182534.1 hypothetical protein [Paenibacillus sp. UMB4589-SE434]